jgi:AraC-like DNA-binding protein
LDETSASPVFSGLERLCATPTGDGIVTAPSYPGIERIEAQFRGDAFDMHRHDTYAIGVTMQGVQTFRYRGERRYSLAGRVIVLHPDEPHDGGAATQEGLTYRMLYLEPSLLLPSLDAGGSGLPFIGDPVVRDARLSALILSAFGALDGVLEPLFVDDFLSRLAPLLARHAETPVRPLGSIARGQVEAAREYLEAHLYRTVRSEELERVTGLDRFALSRHFRAAFATSPHRFLVMRRLHMARHEIAGGASLADVAAMTGFADQSHLTRQFRKAFGMAPGAWGKLTARGRNAPTSTNPGWAGQDHFRVP